MATFGIIAEGITDQTVIENILRGYFENEEDEPVVNYVQPPNDKTSRSANPAPGGWTLVFTHLKAREHLNNLQFNDYVIIHIDTDVCEDVGFDVPRVQNGTALEPKELALRVIEKLKAVIGAEDCTRFGHRILFAIAVHGMECWLMPLFFQNNKAAKISGCLQAANAELKRKDEIPLSNDDGTHKNPASYARASGPYTKRKTLIKLRGENPSLDAFVGELERIEQRESKKDSLP